MYHDKHGVQRCRRIAGAFALVMLLVGSAAQAQDAPAAKTSCNETISSCGCTITATDVYYVTANLSSTQGLTGAGDCIAIQASKVILVLNGWVIAGPGTDTSTGAGIDVLPGSNRDVLEGATEGGTPVVYWKYGVEVQGDHTIADEVGPDENVMGFFLLNSTGTNITDFGFGGNSVYGVWIKGGKNNQINAGDTGGNETGVYVGCHDDDTRGTSCGKGSPTSSGNRIYDLGTGENTDAGIVIDIGNLNNVVTNVGVGPDGGDFDSIDENPNCGTDRWVVSGDTDFGVTNQACIP